MSDAPPPVHPGATAGGDGPLTPDRVDALLADFRGWLLAGGEPAPGPADLAAVVREFTALRHEVHLQTKATRAAVERLGEPADPKDVQRPLVLGLIDVAEALRIGLRQTEEASLALRHFPAVGGEPLESAFPRPDWWERLRGYHQSVEYLTAKGFWLANRARREFESAQVIPRLTAVADGYELSLRRADRALAAAGVTPFGERGERFDPAAMEALALDLSGRPAGTVTDVGRRGYRWHGVVLQFAQVTVAGATDGDENRTDPCQS